MDDTVIEFKNVTKIYKLYKSDKQRLKAIIWKKTPYKEKRAVNNVSFKIQRGDSVALFGRNGAGKSTILKMITEVAFPTTGEIKVNGRVSALLELTSGFDPEFTGRENIYLKGQLLGLDTEEIKELEPVIIEFAQLGDYIDQPVRTYSSGMYSKLAFSITAILETDIMLIDEVLSVGDQKFKKKSYNKMKSLISNRDRTVIIVSHNIDTLKQLCDTVMWMHDGQIKQIGDPEPVLAEYVDFMEKN